MKEYPCEIIRDLLPLYHDGVCAEKTASAVEEHLAGCEACKDVYQTLLHSDEVEPEPPTALAEITEAQSLKRVRGRFHRRTAAICLAAVLVFGIVTGLGVLWMNTATIDLPPNLIDDAYYGHKFNSSQYRIELQYDTLLGSKYYSVGTPAFVGATVTAKSRGGTNDTGPVLLFSRRITLWESLCYDLTHKDAEGYPTDTHVTETAPGAWTHWKSTYIGTAPRGAARTQPIFCERIYFIPDYDLFAKFAELSPEEQTKALNAQAVLVWEG